jgi:hypothetical protein
VVHVGAVAANDNKQVLKESNEGPIFAKSDRGTVKDSVEAETSLYDFLRGNCDDAGWHVELETEPRDACAELALVGGGHLEPESAGGVVPARQSPNHALVAQDRENNVVSVHLHRVGFELVVACDSRQGSPAGDPATCVRPPVVSPCESVSVTVAHAHAGGRGKHRRPKWLLDRLEPRFEVGNRHLGQALAHV